MKIGLVFVLVEVLGRSRKLWHLFVLKSLSGQMLSRVHSVASACRLIAADYE